MDHDQLFRLSSVQLDANDNNNNEKQVSATINKKTNGASKASASKASASKASASKASSSSSTWRVMHKNSSEREHARLPPNAVLIFDDGAAKVYEPTAATTNQFDESQAFLLSLPGVVSNLLVFKSAYYSPHLRASVAGSLDADVGYLTAVAATYVRGRRTASCSNHGADSADSVDWPKPPAGHLPAAAARLPRPNHRHQATAATGRSSGNSKSKQNKSRRGVARAPQTAKNVETLKRARSKRVCNDRVEATCTDKDETADVMGSDDSDKSTVLSHTDGIVISSSDSDSDSESESESSDADQTIQSDADDSAHIDNTNHVESSSDDDDDNDDDDDDNIDEVECGGIDNSDNDDSDNTDDDNNDDDVHSLLDDQEQEEDNDDDNDNYDDDDGVMNEDGNEYHSSYRRPNTTVHLRGKANTQRK